MKKKLSRVQESMLNGSRPACFLCACESHHRLIMKEGATMKLKLFFRSHIPSPNVHLSPQRRVFKAHRLKSAERINILRSLIPQRDWANFSSQRPAVTDDNINLQRAAPSNRSADGRHNPVTANGLASLFLNHFAFDLWQIKLGGGGQEQAKFFFFQFFFFCLIK